MILTDEEKKILIKASSINTKLKLEKGKYEPRMKHIQMSNFFAWFNNEYPDIRYLSNIKFELREDKEFFFKNFQSLYCFDSIMLLPRNGYNAFIFYYFMNLEPLKNEKIQEIKVLRKLGYYTVSVKSVDELKKYFVNYYNYDELLMI